MPANKTRFDPYKNFGFRLVLGAAVAGVAGYFVRKALVGRKERKVRRGARSLLLRVDRLESHRTWNELRLVPDQLGKLRRFAQDAKRGLRAEARTGRSRGGEAVAARAALFAGPSGTGKTMAGQLLAAGLGVDLYRVDLASVVSKAIGETEENLERVFEAAEGSGAVLMLDEADALFGKRTGVKDSHDRYANIDVDYLLQRMEDHDGPIILATNDKNNIDPAFLRRLRYIVDFPPPAATDRAKKPKAPRMRASKTRARP